MGDVVDVQGGRAQELIDLRPPNAIARFVFAHGAGAGMRHPFMESLARALFDERIATTRYEFPYMAAGKKRIDPRPVIEQTIRDVVDRARDDLPLFAGGKSFGGRMTSHVELEAVRGLIFVGFPLHPANKPSTDRGKHLPDIPTPMLFLQGSRDALCDLRRLRPLLKKIPNATLRVFKGADHGFRGVPVAELARVVAEFSRALLVETQSASSGRQG